MNKSRLLTRYNRAYELSVENEKWKQNQYLRNETYILTANSLKPRFWLHYIWLQIQNDRLKTPVWTQLTFSSFS